MDFPFLLPLGAGGLDSDDSELEGCNISLPADIPVNVENEGARAICKALDVDGRENELSMTEFEASTLYRKSCCSVTLESKEPLLVLGTFKCDFLDSFLPAPDFSCK